MKTNTVSLWTELLSLPNRNHFVNLSYKEFPAPLWPSCNQRTLQIWPYHYRWNSEMYASENPIKVRVFKSNLERMSPLRGVVRSTPLPPPPLGINESI